jgi:subtilisin family serine protease
MLIKSRRRASLGLTAIAAAAGAVLPMVAIAPAHADVVRQKQQWVLDAIGASSAWQITQGSGVLVAVIDSGVDPSVSDLTGSVTTGPDLTGVHTPAANPNWGAHGTWMASLIAGHGHGQGAEDGIIGVAPKARILSIRVITDQSDPGYAKYQNELPGRGQRELATAIKYAVKHHAKVISMSLGYNAPSLIVRSALQYAMRHNVVVVASSGNAGSAQLQHGHGHAPYSFPADYPGVIGVAAIGPSGQPAYFSSDNLSVQIAAPGVSVPAEGRGGHYWYVSGTSPACALTAGVAALIKSKYPKMTAPQVRRVIIWSASNRPPGGYDDEIGFGTVDAASALRYAGRLARQHAGGHRTRTKIVAAGYYGGGRSGVPPVPVPPRSVRALLGWCGLAMVFLLLTLASLWRLATGLAASRQPRHAAPIGQPLPATAPPAPPWRAAPPQAEHWQPGVQANGYESVTYDRGEQERRDPSRDPI